MQLMDNQRYLFCVNTFDTDVYIGFDDKLDYTQRINTLAMIAPITNEEKQKLLESISFKNKVDSLESIISFYLYETSSNNQTVQ